MDPTLNRIPQNTRHVHLIAACGTAMGALACMLKDLGLHVTGSDNNVYPPMSTFLEARGIVVTAGFSPRNLDPAPDLVVVGNAVSIDNPEAQEMIRQELPYCSMPQAINHFAASGKEVLLVTGTHGKTTTASMLAWILYCAGRDPAFMIGGIVPGFDSNYRLGKGDCMVIEGDEYDTAFFDKGPKFLHYRPRVAILTSVEFDHADIYRDLEHVKEAFVRFVRRIPDAALLVAADHGAAVQEVLADAACRIERYGEKPGSTWRLGAVRQEGAATLFDLFRWQQHVDTVETTMAGKHNCLNATAAVAAALELGVTVEEAAKALRTFRAPKRRQEIRGVQRGVTVIDDFAHHPTAVRETVAAVRSRFPEGRLIAVFEPRTNTSMRDIFQKVYSEVFDGADLVCIRKPPLLKKVPEGQRFSSEQLVADLRQRGRDAHFFEDTDAIIAFVEAEAAADDTVLVMSNGGFDNIHERLLEALAQG